MSKSFYLILIIVLLGCTKPQGEKNQENTQQKDLVASNFQFASKQLTLALETIGDSKLNPRSTEEDGSLLLVKSKDWTSGFFPGNLWYLYEYTQDKKWKTAAERFTSNIEEQKWNGTTHDMGFKMYCSYGNGYRLTDDSTYEKILIQSAKTLISRYNPTVGTLRSWDHNADKWQFPVIIDNMMNLELLFWATKFTGDSTFYNIAVSHADVTLKNHFREDKSSYHVINYDTLTGLVINKNTHQGYSHESAWSRGQAWGLYGYTMMYRETGEDRYLTRAEEIAEYMLNHKNMPTDLVPYWDYDVPNIINEPKDASAAAVMASSLYELSSYLKSEKEAYLDDANRILESLSSDAYLSKLGENNNFLLMHSTGSKAHDSEVDVSLIYADYYFLEANLRKKKFDK